MCYIPTFLFHNSESGLSKISNVNLKIKSSWEFNFSFLFRILYIVVYIFFFFLFVNLKLHLGISYYLNQSTVVINHVSYADIDSNIWLTSLNLESKNWQRIHLNVVSSRSSWIQDLSLLALWSHSFFNNFTVMLMNCLLTNLLQTKVSKKFSFRFSKKLYNT